MAFPRKLKDMNLFNEGFSYLGEVSSVTLPKLTLKTEDWRGGGMIGDVPIFQGIDKLEMEHAYGGPMRDIMRQFGITDVAGVFLRFVGGFQDDSTGENIAVEVTVRGRHMEIDRGEYKPGEGGEFKVKTQCVYYREDWNGRTELEIDLLNCVFVVGGVDRMAEIRAIIT